MIEHAKFDNLYYLWRDFALGLRHVGHGPKPVSCKGTWRRCCNQARYLRKRGDHRGAVVALCEARMWHNLSKGR